MKNKTGKGRPAPPVQTKDIVDAAAFRNKSEADRSVKDQQDPDPSPQSPVPPPPPAKDTPGFDDDAWSVKPSKQQSNPPQPARQASQPAAKPAQQPALTGSLLDLSLLSPPLQPTPAQPTIPQQPTQPQGQSQNQGQPQSQPGIQLPPQQGPQPNQQQQQQQQQQSGANPTFFSQLNQPPPQNTAQIPSQTFNPQQGLSPQQTGFPRQRPQAPPQVGQPGAIMPPPPARPLSAPQTQQQNNFGPPPLQPQLTGYQPQKQSFGQVAPPGQSLNDLNQQRFQQQQFNQQAQFMQQQQLQPQQTGFMPGGQNFNQFNSGIPVQQTGFQAPAFQNPYVIGQQQGSPFADPMGPKPQFQPSLQPQPTGFQPQPTGFIPSQFQQQGPQASLQPTPTGINSNLPPALQPQNTGMINGFSRPGFGQGVSTPPVPPLPPMPAAAPLQPQRTGPAPSVRFGTQPANKLVPQATGRKANLSAASKCHDLTCQACLPFV